MPPKIQFAKTDLLRAAFSLTRSRGLTAVNARAIAKELGCSTQPIFRAFHSMEEIRQEMLRMAMDQYSRHVLRSGAQGDKPYLRAGMAYLSFARDERELFKMLFMRDRSNDGPLEVHQDESLEYVLELVMRNTGLDRTQAHRFHRHLWIYAHGLASMIATHFLIITPVEAEALLSDQYHAARLLFGLPPLAEP